MISTDEQDGWAYVATGSETYAQWERHRQRQFSYVSELGKHADVTQLLADMRHVHALQRQARG